MHGADLDVLKSALAVLLDITESPLTPLLGVFATGAISSDISRTRFERYHAQCALFLYLGLFPVRMLLSTLQPAPAGGVEELAMSVAAVAFAAAVAYSGVCAVAAGRRAPGLGPIHDGAVDFVERRDRLISSRRAA